MQTSRFLVFGFAASTAIALVLYACTSMPPQPGGDSGYYNPYGVPVDAAFEVRGAATSREFAGKPTVERIPSKSIYVDERTEPKKGEDVPNPQRSKISPLLAERMRSLDANATTELILTFREDQRIPLLPDLASGESRDGGKTKRGAAIEALKRLREESQTRALERLGKQAAFQVLEHFWIVNSATIAVKGGQLELMAESDEVVYLQPTVGGEPPPLDGNANNDAEDARAVIVSDPYFALGLTQPWIGLLDTGVRESHDMFESPDHIAWMRDCVNGGSNCNATSNPGFNTGDFAWNHGTSTAGILVGNAAIGAEYRGVTEVALDSWQIYTAAGLDSNATLRAIQAAIAAFDKVLVGELQAVEDDTGAIATAADNAYDAGVIFVAANGNFGPNDNTVRSPGIAHKVLGVGGFMTDGGAQYGNQGRGPATDGRFKPDVQAPTWSETASNASDTALQVFSGTSGATPYAAAVAMLARNWLQRMGTFDNGQSYAFMILYGQKEWPYDNTSGAGSLAMATNGWAWWGKVSITDQLNCDIPITVSGTKNDFDVSLWWPESASQQHNDIDVHLLDPSGVERAKGYSSAGIFERTQVGGTLATGTWTVRIRGYSVRTSSQVVYWAAHIRNG